MCVERGQEAGHVGVPGDGPSRRGRDQVAIRGILKVDDRWDGDWQLGLYWMEAAEVVK